MKLINGAIKLVPALLLFGLSGCFSPQVKSNFSSTIIDKPHYRMAFASGGILADGIASELLQYGFVVVERSQLSAVLEELKLNMNGVLLPENLKKVGNILNVDALVFVNTVSDPAFEKIIGSVSVKVVEVESGALLGGVNYQNGGCGASGSGCDSNNKESLPEIAQRIAQDIARGFRKTS